MLGFPDQARRSGAAAFRCAAELDQANLTAHVHNFAGAGLAELLGDVAGVRAHGEAMIELAERHNLGYWRVNGLILRGWAMAQEGAAHAGIELMSRNAADRAALGVRVEADALRRYPAEVEATVYFCCLEGLQNAGKYAGEGATAVVRVWEEGGALLFEVSDDGAGFDVTHRASGAGFTNMNDRLGAVGGTLRVESTPGRGTKVRGTIPVEH
jgi:anti-sigma regulatory factor (Ser/Thr protein kinase)